MAVELAGSKLLKNRQRGPITVNYGSDEVQIFSRSSFLDNKDFLVAITAEFMHSELGWSPKVALKIIKGGLEVADDDLENESRIPSVILFGREGVYIGVSAQRCIEIYSRQLGNIPFLQHLFRAFREGYRGEHRGRFVVQQARVIHPEAEYYGHRTQSAPALYANLQSGIFVPGRYYPLETLFDTDLLVQELMVGYFMHARVNGKAVDWSTGVSKDDFPEPNKSYLPRPDHTPTMAIFERMQKEFGMTFPGRDSLHAVGKLR